MKQLIDKLRHKHSLTGEEYAILLTCQDADTLMYLQQQAQEVTLAHFGNAIFIRGLIEVGNRCRNNCYYCGIRKGNPAVARYALKRETILECCCEGYALGFRTFVMQGGEDPALTDEWIEATVAAIRNEFSDCAITLSLGEKSREAYERFFRAGANRYLLRHETHNEQHYRKLHPEEMSLKHRLQCLQWLKEIGYQTGTGIMVGSPGQTLPHLVEDLLFIEQFHPQMIEIEKKWKNVPVSYIPKTSLNVSSEELDIKNGDIIAITTNIKGLDVVHTGFACWVDGKLHLLHASSVMKKVILDSQTQIGRAHV